MVKQPDSTAPTSRHLVALCQEMAARFPERTAIVSGDDELTYRDLEERVMRAGVAFRRLGVGHRSTVGLLCTNRWEWLVAAFGAMACGARVAAFNTWAKSWDLEYMLSHSQAELLVMISGFRGRSYVDTLRGLVGESADAGGWSSARLPHLREIAVIGDEEVPAGARSFDRMLTDAEGEPMEAAGDPDDDAFVLYTSGSAARPKAVPLEHRPLIENGSSIGERVGISSNDRVFVPVPLFWSYGASNAMPATFTHGAALVLQESFAPEAALDLIAAHRCTVAYTLPNITNAILRDPSFERARCSSLRTGLTIGSSEDILRAANELGITDICNIYGSTECYGNCCITPVSWPLERKLACQGPPLPGFELRIVDPESGAPMATGKTGEIRLRGHVTRGYLDPPQMADQAIRADGWYITGDLGWLDEEGALHFHARATDMIKTGGINVAPREIEELLSLYPELDEAIVVGAPDSELGEVVVAFVTPRPEKELAGEEVRSWCAERVAAYKVPAEIVVMSSLPTTGTGKAHRRELRSRAREAWERRASASTR